MADGGDQVVLSGLARRLVDGWQDGFPLSPTPYADIAAVLGVSEAAVLGACQELLDAGVLDRIGPVFAPNRVGASTLAALAVPPARLEAVAALVSALPEVNHNYEREHAFNLWFVVTAQNRERVAAVLALVRERTGLEPLDLPLEQAYHIDLGFPVSWA